MNDQNQNPLLTPATEVQISPLPIRILLSITILITAILEFAFYLPELERWWAAAFFALIALFSAIVGLILSFQKRVHISAIIFVVFAIFGANFVGYQYLGLRNPSVLALLFLLVPLSSLYLNRRLTIIITAVVTTNMVFMYFGAQFGLGNYEPVDIDDLIITITAFVGAVTIMEAVTYQLRTSLATLQQSNKQMLAHTAELEEIRIDLEESVASRTELFERRAHFLNAAAEVGRAATSIYALDELLPQVVQFISERFGFYQAGIFMIDELGEFAEMRAASSPGGRRMLARGHKLKVGQEGIVGYVTSTGEVRIALDVGEDAVHFNTPELPDTRSEMAMPLFSGGRLFGALDVQSTEPNAFREDDVAALRVLADQVAMAINNAILFEQLQESLESERRAYGEVSRSAWQLLRHTSESWGFHYFDQKIMPSRAEWTADMISAITSRSAVKTQHNNQPVLALPVQVADEPVGVIRLSKKADGEAWTLEEIELMEILAASLGEALESARLYQETQRQAAQELLTGDITSKIRETLDIDQVLRTAAKEFGEAFNAQEVIIRMGDNRQ